MSDGMNDLVVPPPITKAERRIFFRKHAPPRSRAPRPPLVFDQDGNEVLITMLCRVCHRMKPLRDFGLRRMAGGQIRNCPRCKKCRAGSPRSGGTAGGAK